MKDNMSSDTKVTVTKGCLEYLVQEIESLRLQNRLMSAENQVINRFLNIFERLGPTPTVGYAEDKLWQAKREIEKALGAVNCEH